MRARKAPPLSTGETPTVFKGLVGLVLLLTKCGLLSLASPTVLGQRPSLDIDCSVLCVYSIRAKGPNFSTSRGVERSSKTEMGRT